MLLPSDIFAMLFDASLLRLPPYVIINTRQISDDINAAIIGHAAAATVTFFGCAMPR